jgi:CHAT domain-containing protein/tetratricopeptide (TPR) repeat protein
MSASGRSIGRSPLPGGPQVRPREIPTPALAAVAVAAGLFALCLFSEPAAATAGTPAPASAAATAPSPPAAPAPHTLDHTRALIRDGKYADAEREARALLREAEQASGPDSLAVADVLDVLGEAMRRGTKAGDPETRAICERSIAIRGKALGTDDPAYATSLYLLGYLLYVNGDYAGAKPLLERALAIREAKLPPDDPLVASTLVPLGALVSDMGDQVRAEAMFERVLRIREAEYGRESPGAAEALEAIASIRFRSGDFAGSIPLHEEALHITERTLGPDHVKVATCLNNLGGAFAETGDYEAALACSRRALQIRKNAFGPNHEYVATTLYNCGNYAAAEGQLTQARKYYDQALSIWEARFGAGSDDVGRALTRIALLYLQRGRYREARPYLIRAVTDIEGALGPDHPDLADPLAALATTSAALGDTAQAWRSYERAIAIRVKSLGPTHPDVGLVQTQYARALAACGRYADALEHALAGEEISREHLRLTTQSFAERQALDYAAARPPGVRVATSALLGIPDAPVRDIDRVWDAVARARMLVLDEMAFRSRAAAEQGDSETVRLSAELMDGRRRLANLLVAGPGGDSPARYRATVDRTREETERTERALAARSASFRSSQGRGRIGLSDVAPALPHGCALVAYTTAGDSSSLAYLAFVLPSSEAAPVVVPLGLVSKIDAEVYKWLADVSGGGGSGGERVSRASGATLRQAVWDPVSAHVRGARRVFIVPEGTISLVSFAACPTGASTYLIEGAQEFHYLSAERDLVPVAGPTTSGAGLLALGDPNFDLGDGHKAAAVTQRNSAPPCEDFASVQFGALPQSGMEARDVAAIWGNASETVLLTGDEATEPAFESRSPGRKVLHVATHGFFLDGSCGRGTGRSRGIGGVSSTKSPAKKKTVAAKPSARQGSPLLLSGLAFAGANARALAKPDEEDGVLTAQEISSLDLSGVQWAVLSACDTGRGRIRAGEGVEGLRRAFQVAGAATVIMSLWEVEDSSTRDWMEALYEGRVHGGLDTADAVTQASLHVLRERRARARSTDPFYWAAFVAAGDWR